METNNKHRDEDEKRRMQNEVRYDPPNVTQRKNKNRLKAIAITTYDADNGPTVGVETNNIHRDEDEEVRTKCVLIQMLHTT
jgi:hypothetical protein